MLHLQKTSKFDVVIHLQVTKTIKDNRNLKKNQYLKGNTETEKFKIV